MLTIAKNILHGDKSVALTQPGHDTALLIMPGFGTFETDWHDMAHAYAAVGDVDVLLPDIFQRRSIDACVTALAHFLRQHQVERYRAVHVFSYILGAWVFNRYANANPLPNLTHIVYDRSPIQDLAARAVVENIPLVPRLVAGRILADFAYTPYEPLQQAGVTIGLMIENGVAATMWPFRRWVLAQRPLTWDTDQYTQPHVDHCYVPLGHEQMYKHYDVFTGELRHFYAHGCFSENARREPYTTDPFTHRVTPDMAKG
jgi:hypothetical protein